MGLLEEGDLARPGSEPTQGINGAMEGVMMESGKGGTFCRSFQVSVLHDDRAMGERAGDALVVVDYSTTAYIYVALWV